MRKLIRFLFVVLFLSAVVDVSAQNTITKSSEIVQDVNGNNFYLHHVTKGQTLYAISKAYSVDVEDIEAVNPDAVNGIKDGQNLKIPIKDSLPKSKTVGAPIAPTGFTYHQVRKGETLYKIMVDYQLTMADLLKYNDGLNSNIQPGQWILIPDIDTRLSLKAENKYDSLVLYTLKRRDNYYRLEKKFKINQQQIEQLNPKLKSIGLQKGIVIKVPYIHNDFVAPSYSKIVLDSINPNLLLEDSSKVGMANCVKINHNRHTYHIGFMMPFFANLESEIDVVNTYKIKKQSEYKSLRFIQFIQGAKLALDSLEKLGLKAEVYFWDTQANEHITDSICKTSDFKKLDLLIGPFYSKNTKIARIAADSNNIAMVDIFGTYKNINGHGDRYFVMKASEQDNYNALAKYISDSISDYRISIIHQGHSDELVRLSELKKALYSQYLHIDTNRIFEYKYQEGGLNTIISSLDMHTNIIFNLVNDEARISNFLRQLNLKKKDNNIMVFALYKDWSRFKTIELEYLSNLKYTYATDYYICNSDSNTVIPFQNHFYNTYKRMPEKLGFIGYDISWYFANALFYYGSNFNICLSEFDFKTMHNRLIFVPTIEGAYINTKVNVIQYDNYYKFKKNL